MKRIFSLFLAAVLLLSLTACGKTPAAGNTTAPQAETGEPTTLVYGSIDYTRINPAMDEHC